MSTISSNRGRIEVQSVIDPETGKGGFPTPEQSNRSSIREEVRQQGRKFSKIESIYFSGLGDFKTGLPLNLVQLIDVTCSKCVFFQEPNRCEVVGLATDLGGEDIDPNGVSRFFIPKDAAPGIGTELSRIYNP